MTRWCSLQIHEQRWFSLISSCKKPQTTKQRMHHEGQTGSLPITCPVVPLLFLRAHQGLSVSHSVSNNSVITDLADLDSAGSCQQLFHCSVLSRGTPRYINISIDIHTGKSVFQLFGILSYCHLYTSCDLFCFDRSPKFSFFLLHSGFL